MDWLVSRWDLSAISSLSPCCLLLVVVLAPLAAQVGESVSNGRDSVKGRFEQLLPG
jgi:cytochrome c biogenesis protein CcdA